MSEPQRRPLGVSRRRLIQGGVAAGVVMSAPVFPFAPIARAREIGVVAEPIDLATARPTSAPAVVASQSSATLAPMARATSSGGLLVPVIESDPFHGVGVSFTGGHDTIVTARVRSAGSWGTWTALHADGAHGPDPDDVPPTDRRVSEPLWVDGADAVELIVPQGAGDVLLHRVRETDQLAPSVAQPAAGAAPWIRSRAEWNAAAYRGTPYICSQIRLAIVHHSAGPNGYTLESVPSRIRSIQAYHQDGNGWDDAAYNFFVDRFGQLWEGRAGGIDKAVRGGHTYGANTDTIGVCYIGTLSSGVRMPQAAVDAITNLLSWKFNRVHAVSPSGATYYALSATKDPNRHPANVVRVRPSVVGHTDMGPSECPGDYAVPPSILSRLTARGDVRGISPAPGGDWDGTWVVTGSGQAFPHQWTAFYGSMAGERLNAPMISMAPTPSGHGYWMLAADGGIFTFGDARFYGSTGSMRLNKPVVGMARTRTGRGYWLVASDGGIFTFGDAGFYGSTGSMHLNQPVIGMAPTATGRGYWLVASDGGIFTFGDATFFGSGGGNALPSPAVGVAPHPSGRGYWLALANGTVRSYGSVPYHGSGAQPSHDPVVGIASTADGGGYWLAARSGKVISFGNAT
jgi:hypothetical protein